MNRELTKREKTLLLVLVVLVLVLGYCKLFLEPIDRQITSFRTNTDIEQAELDTDRVRLAQLEQMQQAIAAIKASGQERALPQYDNDQALMTELDKLWPPPCNTRWTAPRAPPRRAISCCAP